MKAMKSMNMNRMLGSIRRKANTNDQPVDTSPETVLDTPEANATRNVRLFCESGGPNGSGEEVLYLPSIVEACESSPSAAKEASYVIRKFLSKDNFTKPYVQYNAIMLVRILSDNPGRTFTRNLDAKFVQVVKELLRTGRDPSVKQILMETLDTFKREKANDEGLALLIDMWNKEHDKMVKIHGPAGPRTLIAPPFQQEQNYFSRNHHSRRLPAPHELSSRIEEARTSAGLLSQVVQSTPPSEIITNELVREFADRCQSASRSIQAYMIAENPSPDNDTMETLIETNEQLNKALGQHQRAILNARKAAGVGSGQSTPPPNSNQFSPPPGPPPGRTNTGFDAPPGPPPAQSRQSAPATRKPVKSQPPIPPPGDYAPTGSDDENPFSDPKASTTHNQPFPREQQSTSTDQSNHRLAAEPYHPGFRETPSYVGRQESSLGKVTMHAAVPEREEDSDDERRGYGVQPGTKEPSYRY